jgi:hypothetical protein
MANQPNQFELSGGGIHVTFSTTSFSGKPLFNYHDSRQSKNFSGDEIKTEESALGMLATVFLQQTADSGSTSFTLIVPDVSLPPSDVANIRTEGITTLHRSSIIPILGQTEFYTVHPMHGTATFVVS